MDPLDLSVRELLQAVADPTPEPAAGSVTALTAALAAALAEMSARASTRQLPGAADLAERAQQARVRVSPLAERDGIVYAGVLEARALPRDDPARAEALRVALEQASEVPLEMAVAAAESVEVADLVAREGNPHLRDDALAAALLGRASVAAAAVMVEANLARISGEDHPLRVRARSLVEQVGASALLEPRSPGAPSA